ncbi:MAG: class I SAM-dependent methyltransferase [Magnetococcales bacterium]|nr:class I SAM-dependent methyltransferase [Magnetococcales bacterium]
MKTFISPPVWTNIPAKMPQARQLAERLGADLLFESQQIQGIHLALTETRLELRRGDGTSEGPVFAEFIQGKMGYRRGQGVGRKEPIARAVGIKGDYLPTVLDATPGLGQDGFILATLGCSVRWVERSPVMAAILLDGLKRALADIEVGTILSNNTDLLVLDAQDYMRQNSAQNIAPEEVVYLDPMYPHRTKSALVKKEMRLIRQIVGEDDDSEALLSRALSYAKNRVVVKRPHPTPPLAGVKADFCIIGKKTRFDIYLTSH